jgi:hypothetical protein
LGWSKVEVPGVGHDAEGMLGSELVAQALFGERLAELRRAADRGLQEVELGTGKIPRGNGP